MPYPNLTFFCELKPDDLLNLIDEPLLSDLKDLNARISLGLLDLSPERAEVVRRLNRMGVSVIAWLLLPREQGYWLNLRNAPEAFGRYFEFKDWSAANKLRWAGVGLDIEPEINELMDIMRHKWRNLPQYFLRLFARLEWKRGLTAYRRLVAQIHQDGYRVETYQFPLIVDERKAHSSILQRVLGLVDLAVDREVWMLYTSYVRPHGAGIIASYADEAQAIAVGSTGGGVDVDVAQSAPLTWEELERDLRLAWYWCNDLYIFSLEGCAQQGFLERLKSFTWDYPVILPDAGSTRVDGWRRSLQSLLWFISHLIFLIGAGIAGFVAWKIVYRILLRNKPISR